MEQLIGIGASALVAGFATGLFILSAFLGLVFAISFITVILVSSEQ